MTMPERPTPERLAERKLRAGLSDLLNSYCKSCRALTSIGEACEAHSYLFTEIDALTRERDEAFGVATEKSIALGRTMTQMEAENARLAAELATARRFNEDLEATKKIIEHECDNLAAQVKELRQFARHAPWCKSVAPRMETGPVQLPCSCGLERVLAETTPKEPSA